MLWLVALLGVLIGVFGFGASSQALVTSRVLRKFLAPGTLIEVNGNGSHYQVIGEGHPTVVVDSWQGATHCRTCCENSTTNSHKPPVLVSVLLVLIVPIF